MHTNYETQLSCLHFLFIILESLNPVRQDETNGISTGIKANMETIRMYPWCVRDSKYRLEPNPLLPDITRAMGSLGALSNITDCSDIFLRKSNLIVEHCNGMATNNKLESRDLPMRILTTEKERVVVIIICILNQFQNKVSVLAVELKGETLYASLFAFTLLFGHQLLLRIEVDSNSKFIVSDCLY